MKVSKNFYLSEFNGVQPELDLLMILQTVRDKIGHKIIITDSARTIEEHINIYKKIHGDNWQNVIPWKSRHLPCWRTSKLRAVDIKCEIGKNKYLEGKILFDIVKKEASKLNIPIGLAHGNFFIHLDVDRKKYTTWKPYNY